MAIEQGLGAGGLPDEPVVEDNTRILEIPQLPANPGLTEFDDGSAIVGEYEEEKEPVEEIEFEGNLADVMDEGDLNDISSDLVGSIDDSEMFVNPIIGFLSLIVIHVPHLSVYGKLHQLHLHGSCLVF